jgi:cell division protein FtsL
MTSVVVTGMVVGVASLSALLVQTTFRVEELEATIAAARDTHETLTEQVASRSSPSRIAAWALGRGMVMPEDVVVIQVHAARGDTGAAPAGFWVGAHAGADDGR